MGKRRGKTSNKAKLLLSIFLIPGLEGNVIYWLNSTSLENVTVNFITIIANVLGVAFLVVFFGTKDLEKMKTKYIVLAYLISYPLLAIQMFKTYGWTLLSAVWPKRNEQILEDTYQNYG